MRKVEREARDESMMKYGLQENLTGQEEEHLINVLRGLEGYHYNYRELMAFKRLSVMTAMLDEKTFKSEFYNDLGWQVVDILVDELFDLKKQLYGRRTKDEQDI